MVLNEVVGNIRDIKELSGYHVETIFLDSDDMLKRIIRAASDHGREYGISLEGKNRLQDGDILYNKDGNLIVVKVNSEDVLVIKPKSIGEMGKIAHALGNRHLQAQFHGDEMIVQYDRLVEDELKKEGLPYSRENMKLEKPFRHVEFGHKH